MWDASVEMGEEELASSSLVLHHTPRISGGRVWVVERCI